MPAEIVVDRLAACKDLKHTTRETISSVRIRNTTHYGEIALILDYFQFFAGSIHAIQLAGCIGGKTTNFSKWVIHNMRKNKSADI